MEADDKPQLVKSYHQHTERYTLRIIVDGKIFESVDPQTQLDGTKDIIDQMALELSRLKQELHDLKEGK
jgi:predicted transcriptional regulator